MFIHLHKIRFLLILIVKTYKHHKSVSSDKWLNKMWCTHSRLSYSAVERNEALIDVATWVNMESMLCERSQTQILLTVWFHFFGLSRIGKSMETENRLGIACKWGEERLESDCLIGLGSFFGVVMTFWN